MFKASEAKEMVKAYKEAKAAKVKDTAKKWVEQNAEYDIKCSAKQGEDMITYHLDTSVFTPELLEAVAEILEEAGYEVDCSPIQGAVRFTIDW